MTLLSPGVEVDIIDQSAYASSGPGTIPLIVIATAANKLNPAGTGYAPYTVPSQAGQLFTATSQNELAQNYGNPLFKVVEGTPVQGYETNEVGLLAAYQYLGVSNECNVIRANIDTTQLDPSATAPVGPPTPGTYWFNTQTTKFGVFSSTGNVNPGIAWQSATPLIATTPNIVTSNGVDMPSSSFGSNGNFSVVVTQSNNLVYEKISGAWHAVGSTSWKSSHPTIVTGSSSPAHIANTDVFTIDGVNVSYVGNGDLANVVTAINTASISNVTASVSSSSLRITDSTGNAITFANQTGTPLATLGITAGVTPGVTFYQTNNSQYPSGSGAGSVWIKGSPTNNGASWFVQIFSSATSSWVTVPAPFYPFGGNPNVLADGNPSKDSYAITAMPNPSIGALYVGYWTDGTQQLRYWNGTEWTNLVYEAGSVAPSTVAPSGTLWYNTTLGSPPVSTQPSSVDIMYGSGEVWKGYLNQFPETDPNGVQLSGSAPLTQSGGGGLVDNDLWIDSSDLENYPALYRYDASLLQWVLMDNTDDTSPFGIIFQDARVNSGPTYVGNATGYSYNSTNIGDMLLSNYVEPDAPNPVTYPSGMLLFNTRYSTYNVKQYLPNYFKAGGFNGTNYTQNTYTVGDSPTFPALTSAGRWVTASGNDVNGSPFMGRKAQRVMIVRAMESVLETNQDILAEDVNFNLIAAPGYPELMTQMVALNIAMKQVAFVVGDTPIALPASATSIQNWATNAADVAATGENGLTLANPYVGLYYPWGLSTDLSGNAVMVPPSSVALLTIAYNDSVAYPWYAPAGFNRGSIINATSVGYLDRASGKYIPVKLNEGLRNVLYANNINPFAYIPNKGLTVLGQKTLNPTSTALDRINVARLCNYLAYNLPVILAPFLFEQNDVQTRTAAQQLVVNYLSGLVGLNAIDDYSVVCDLTNNTPQTIDENQLWIDIAIIPTKTIEFIYVPIRLVAHGTTLPLSSAG
jgi:hypothetical protein